MPLTPPRALVLAMLLASPAAQAQAPAPATPATPGCDVCTTWNADQAPFRIFGNTYYVGVKGLSSVLVGDARQVADQLESWLDETGIDGFNLAFAVAHDSMADVVTHIVPELQRRGRYRTAYEEGSLRHKVFGQGPRLPADHAGRQVSIAPGEATLAAA